MLQVRPECWRLLYPRFVKRYIGLQQCLLPVAANRRRRRGTPHQTHPCCEITPRWVRRTARRAIIKCTGWRSLSQAPKKITWPTHERRLSELLLLSCHYLGTVMSLLVVVSLLLAGTDPHHPFACCQPPPTATLPPTRKSSSPSSLSRIPGCVLLCVRCVRLRRFAFTRVLLPLLF